MRHAMALSGQAVDPAFTQQHIARHSTLHARALLQYILAPTLHPMTTNVYMTEDFDWANRHGKSQTPLRGRYAANGGDLHLRMRDGPIVGARSCPSSEYCIWRVSGDAL